MTVKAEKVSVKRDGLTFRWAYPSFENPVISGEFPAYIPDQKDLKYKRVLRKIQEEDRLKVLYYEIEELLKLI
jgi:hypothetical protein